MTSSIAGSDFEPMNETSLSSLPTTLNLGAYTAEHSSASGDDDDDEGWGNEDTEGEADESDDPGESEGEGVDHDRGGDLAENQDGPPTDSEWRLFDWEAYDLDE